MTAPSTVRTATDLSGRYVIDNAHSRIGFVARHAMVTKVRGAFNDYQGWAEIDGASPAASKAELTVQVASIDTRQAQRDEHLRSNDFLAIADYPTITFTSTEVRAKSDDVYEVTGDLTIRGVTRRVTVPFHFEGAATDPFGNERAGFEGTLSIKRSDYGISWNAALETGGVLVSDKIDLEFEISAIKQKAE